jgi:hypothetical protein
MGFYLETEPKVLLRDDMVITAFRDRAVFKDENGYHTERQMTVDGKRFYVKSFFPSSPKATATAQLLKLIESSTKNK